MKYLLRFIFLSVCLFSSISYAQTLESHINFGGDYLDKINEVVKAPNGDIYVVGDVTDMTDCNPFGAPVNITLPSAPATNALIAKYNSDMILSWMVSFRGNADQLLLDDSLNVYVMGSGSGNIDFNPSADIDTLNWGDGGVFLAKYDHNGSFINVISVLDVGQTLSGLPTGERREELFKDDSANIYTYLDSTLTKYNSDLDIQWVEEMNGHLDVINNSEFRSVKLENIPSISGNEYALTLEQFNATTGGLISSTNYGYNEGGMSIRLIEKTENNGLLVYGHYWGLLQCYVGNDTVEFENNNYDPNGGWEMSNAYICKLDSSGNLLWVKTIETIEGVGLNPEILEVDQDGNIYAIGNFYNPVNFSVGNSPIIHNPGTVFPTYIAKYDDEFNYLGMSQDLGDHSYVLDVKAYADTMLICGSFFEFMDMDLTSSGENTITTEEHDAFVLKYSNFDITNNSLTVLEEEVESNFFTLYSSQSSREVVITVNDNTSTLNKYRISVYDSYGRLLMYNTTKALQTKLDLSTFSTSIYYIQVSNGIWSATEKVVK